MLRMLFSELYKIMVNNLLLYVLRERSPLAPPLDPPWSKLA